MSTCTLFGHRDTPSKIEPLLRKTLINLITEKGVTRFLAGNQGAFDTLVRNTLRSLQTDYPHIDYAVVLAYMPTQNLLDTFDENTNTVFPEGLETVPPRFAISKRNRWMIEESTYIVTFVEHHGGAATFQKTAVNKKKVVINLAQSSPTKNATCD